MVSLWSVEMEAEVRQWIEGLTTSQFGTLAIHLDRLNEQGMPHSRSLGEGLFELRFDLEKVARRITFFFPGQRRIVLLTTFRKQRSNERAEVARAREAMARCILQAHTAEE
jgi:putative component of toxin-antitoxin plasmid stabilization module